MWLQHCYVPICFVMFKLFYLILYADFSILYMILSSAVVSPYLDEQSSGHCCPEGVVT